MLFRTLVLVPQIGFDNKGLEIIRLYTAYKLNIWLKRNTKTTLRIG